MYCQFSNYLLETYATEDSIIAAEAKITKYEPTVMMPVV